MNSDKEVRNTEDGESGLTAMGGGCQNYQGEQGGRGTAVWGPDRAECERRSPSRLVNVNVLVLYSNSARQPALEFLQYQNRQYGTTASSHRALSKIRHRK